MATGYSIAPRQDPTKQWLRHYPHMPLPESSKPALPFKIMFKFTKTLLTKAYNLSDHHICRPVGLLRVAYTRRQFVTHLPSRDIRCNTRNTGQDKHNNVFALLFRLHVIHNVESGFVNLLYLWTLYVTYHKNEQIHCWIETQYIVIGWKYFEVSVSFVYYSETTNVSHFTWHLKCKMYLK